MSIRAMLWVFDEAEDLPAHLVSTLLALAEQSSGDDHHAYPGQERLAHRTRKTVRQIRRDLEALERLDLITKGDQQYVAHIRMDRRPLVWSLQINERTSTSARDVTTGHPGQNDRTPMTATGGHPRPTNQVLNQEKNPAAEGVQWAAPLRVDHRNCGMCDGFGWIEDENGAVSRCYKWASA